MHSRRASEIAGCRFARREQSDLISVKAGIRVWRYDGFVMARPLAALYDEHRSIAAVLATMEALVRRASGSRTCRSIRRCSARCSTTSTSSPSACTTRKRRRCCSRTFGAVPAPQWRRDPRRAGPRARIGRAGDPGARAGVRALRGGRARELEPFAAAVERFAGRYRAHMDKEERQIMPLAQRVLTAQDWAEIEAAFASHRDPLAGVSAGSRSRGALPPHPEHRAGAARARAGDGQETMNGAAGTGRFGACAPHQRGDRGNPMQIAGRLACSARVGSGCGGVDCLQ